MAVAQVDEQANPLALPEAGREEGQALSVALAEVACREVLG